MRPANFQTCWRYKIANNFNQIKHHVHQLPVVMADVTATISAIKEDLNRSVSWQWTTVWDTVWLQSLKQAAIKTYNLWLSNITLNASIVILSDADFTELQRESTTPADSQIFRLNGNKIFYLTRYMIVFWIAIHMFSISYLWSLETQVVFCPLLIQFP